MKLFFDHNLSPRLISRLADLYPDSNHLFNLNLDTAADFLVWEYARDNDFSIVTKDSDFSELSLLRGFPLFIMRPKQKIRNYLLLFCY